MSAKTGRATRLPTEAEWEYACRAGSTTVYHFGDDSSQLARYAWYAWYDKNGPDVGHKYAHEAGQKQPNAWGLYDTYGNVWEWCQDRYEKGYPSTAQTDPKGPARGYSRVLRGGSWYDGGRICRPAARHGSHPSGGWRYSGFRVVVSSSSAVD